MVCDLALVCARDRVVHAVTTRCVDLSLAEVEYDEACHAVWTVACAVWLWAVGDCTCVEMAYGVVHAVWCKLQWLLSLCCGRAGAGVHRVHVAITRTQIDLS